MDMIKKETASMRLRKSRIAAGYKSAADVSRRNPSITDVTYRSHENGTRHFTKETAERYGKIFNVSDIYLLFGNEKALSQEYQKIPLYACTQAGRGVEIMPDPVDWIDALGPIIGVKEAYAVMVQGESMEPRIKHGNIIYIDPRMPMIGRPCLIQKADNTSIVKDLLAVKNDRYIFHQSNPEKEIVLMNSEIKSVHRVVLIQP